MVFPVSVWMVLWHQEPFWLLEQSCLLESWATLNPGRVIHLPSAFSGKMLKQLRASGAFCPSPDPGFLGGECLRFGDMISFNPLSCQREIDVFFALSIEV